MSGITNCSQVTSVLKGMHDPPPREVCYFNSSAWPKYYFEAITHLSLSVPRVTMPLLSSRGSQNLTPDFNTTTPPSQPPRKGATRTRKSDGIRRAQIKRATRTRKIFAILSSLFLLISVIFLLLVEIGNTHVESVLTSIYFVRLDLSQILPQSVPDTSVVNTMAQSLGLHDFYQFGLWAFCEGYVSEGITDCSTPKVAYWFNPVQILLNELLAGATSSLPLLFSQSFTEMRSSCSSYKGHELLKYFTHRLSDHVWPVLGRHIANIHTYISVATFTLFQLDCLSSYRMHPSGNNLCDRGIYHRDCNLYCVSKCLG